MLNQIVLQGRFTRDPQLRYGKDAGNPVCRFSIATEHNYRIKGEKQISYIPCVAFGNVAENINKYFKKGSMIIVSGELAMTKYVKDEKTETSYDVRVSGFNFAGESRRKDGSEPETTDTEKDAVPTEQSIEQNPIQEEFEEIEIPEADNADLPF